MGKHTENKISYWEARQRRKGLRARKKPPKRKGPTKKRWFVLFFLIGFLVGGALGVYYKPIMKIGAKVYLAIKQRQWQPSAKEKKEVEKALTAVSEDPNKSVNTLVLGSDSGSVKGEKGWCRSDVMMLVCLHERDKKAVVISIPRDTRMTIPGHGTNKINAAHSYGGPSTAIDAVKQLLGIDVNHYVSMDFDGFAKIVNAIGGVPIHLSKAINDPNAGYLPAGDQVLDGWQALALVRSRKLPGGDLDRIKSQQAFIKALITKASSMRSVWKAKQLVDIVASSCKMDYTAGEITTLAEELIDFPITNVQLITIPGQPKFMGGGSYFVADPQGIAELAAEVNTKTEISPELMAKLKTWDESSRSRVEEVYGPEADVVTVLSGDRSTVSAVAVVAEELRLLGHQQVFEGRSRKTHNQTTLYYRSKAEDTCKAVKKSIPELDGAVMVQDDKVATDYNSPVVLVLGEGFATPGLVSIYGRVMKPAVDLPDLGETVKSFS